MNVKRKTVRFQDSLSDLAVYDAILIIRNTATAPKAIWSLKRYAAS